MLALKKEVESNPSIESILNMRRIKHVLNPHTGKLEKVSYTLNDMMIEALAHEKKDEE
ncbi:hypothetical protein [Exiguobacterium sp.]|uniref:hypothetical protein n=1 Tax=Exiguobacterium sp. TaxID=44751 RepID=UPI0028984A65|nr:hypothetical protein [Exiguobacterium sp.]